jgi:hypothetical protein
MRTWRRAPDVTHTDRLRSTGPRLVGAARARPRSSGRGLTAHSTSVPLYKGLCDLAASEAEQNALRPYRRHLFCIPFRAVRWPQDRSGRCHGCVADRPLDCTDRRYGHGGLDRRSPTNEPAVPRWLGRLASTAGSAGRGASSGSVARRPTRTNTAGTVAGTQTTGATDIPGRPSHGQGDTSIRARLASFWNLWQPGA